MSNALHAYPQDAASSAFTYLIHRMLGDAVCQAAEPRPPYASMQHSLHHTVLGLMMMQQKPLAVRALLGSWLT